MIRRFIMSTLAVATLTGPAEAQRIWTPAPGARVRLITPMNRAPTLGAFAASDSLRAVVRVGRASFAEVPWSEISSFAVSRGIDRGKGAKRGLAAGFLIGTAWFIAEKPTADEDPFRFGILIMGLGAFGVVPGLGAAIGAGLAPEQWDSVAIPVSRPPSSLALRLSGEDRLLARTTSGTLRGRAVRSGADSLVLESRTGLLHAASWNDVTDLRILGDRDRKRGALRGVVIVTALTAVGVATDPLPSFGENVGVFASNALFGALIGSFFPMKRWVGLPVPKS